MRVKLLEKVIHAGQSYEEDDIRTVDPALGAYFCSNGWAEDVDGVVPTGEHSTVSKRISPDTLQQIMG